ncbi:hypothetical protein UVI_02063930 [Ustilaginoidea virens]|uniref:Uncharacterized protein n=1 Tax=Ustilaginoidea virens TaxID=1159556 RepID=A0A1B5V958_USTVR|nr:hypothetical protein UVI_02063930 [Ustilaginoidea virens]
MDYRPTIQSPATAKDDLIDILTSLNPTDLASPTGPAGPTGPANPTGPTNPISLTDLFPQEAGRMCYEVLKKKKTFG